MVIRTAELARRMSAFGPQNVYLIPARRNLEEIDAVLSTKYKFGNPKDILKPLIDRIRDRFDYIFLDTAPNLTLPTVAAYNLDK